jgi:hypothetical protein
MTKILNSSAAGFSWTKSSFSGGNNDCVEVAHGAIPHAMPVRDSKRPAGPALVVSDAAWGAFVGSLKRSDAI